MGAARRTLIDSPVPKQPAAVAGKHGLLAQPHVAEELERGLAAAAVLSLGLVLRQPARSQHHHHHLHHQFAVLGSRGGRVQPLVVEERGLDLVAAALHLASLRRAIRRPARRKSAAHGSRGGLAQPLVVLEAESDLGVVAARPFSSRRHALRQPVQLRVLHALHHLVQHQFPFQVQLLFPCQFPLPHQLPLPCKFLPQALQKPRLRHQS